ncbi:unnamed protein product [Tenebrio molitor]|nr:unnamed protein product [Tenebrio molitor]
MHSLGFIVSTVASTEFGTHWTFHWHNFIKMRFWRHLGETSVMITYIMIDYNDNLIHV